MWEGRVKYLTNRTGSKLSTVIFVILKLPKRNHLEYSTLFTELTTNFESLFMQQECSRRHWTVISYTVEWSPLHPVLFYCTVRYGTVQYSTLQYSTVRYGTVQYSTAQYSTVQYSKVQYSTVQYKYSTVHPAPCPSGSSHQNQGDSGLAGQATGASQYDSPGSSTFPSNFPTLYPSCNL